MTQALKQAPQWNGSFARAMQRPLHSESPGSHKAGATQTPPLQIPLAQTLPHPPQALTLLVVVVSQPSPMLPLQLPKPAVHWIEHMPIMQEGVPLFALQTFPQVPQWERCEALLISQPLFALSSQSLQPIEQPESRH